MLVFRSLVIGLGSMSIIAGGAYWATNSDMQLPSLDLSGLAVELPEMPDLGWLSREDPVITVATTAPTATINKGGESDVVVTTPQPVTVPLTAPPSGSKVLSDRDVRDLASMWQVAYNNRERIDEDMNLTLRMAIELGMRDTEQTARIAINRAEQTISDERESFILLLRLFNDAYAVNPNGVLELLKNYRDRIEIQRNAPMRRFFDRLIKELPGLRSAQGMHKDSIDRIFAVGG